jgi:Holliday junction resolvase
MDVSRAEYEPPVPAPNSSHASVIVDSRQVLLSFRLRPGPVVKPMNSCQKGKRGERLWRDDLLAHGYQARRGQQFSGTPDSPDVVCPDLPGIHFEVKTTEHLRIHEALAQAVNDAGQKVPVVAHKRNRGDWLVTMKADEWFKLLAKAQSVIEPPVLASSGSR